MMSDDKIVGTKRASEILDLTQARVCQLCKSGRLPAKRVGSMWVMKIEDIEYYKTKYPKYSRN